MPSKGQSLSEETKQLIREARAKQIHPSLVARGITQQQIEEANANGLRWCGGGCAQFLDLSNFTEKGRVCRTCNRLKRAEWRAAASPDVLRDEADKIRAWREKNKVYVRDQEISKKYGVDAGWYERQLELQDGHCALCPVTKNSGKRKYFCIDHHHYSGKVRALLCNSCNYMLGFLEKKDQIRKFFDGMPDVEWGHRATSYLATYKE